MTSREERQREMERLQYLLDVYGGDRDRWPPAERQAVARLLEYDRQAQQLVREACALDLMIEGSHLRSPQRPNSDVLANLSDRIFAQALAEKKQVQSANLVRAGSSQTKPQSRLWRAASLLAACLVLGILVGRSGVLLPPGEQVAEVAGAEEALAGLLLDDGVNFFSEEDTI